MTNTLASTGAAHEQVESEVELVALIRQGDDQAFARLIATYGGRMHSVARRFLRCPEDCADALQEAFLSAFRSIASFEGGASLATWLHRIVVNACLMKLRTQARRPTVPLDDLLPTFDETGHHTRAVAAWDQDALAQLTRAETRAQVRACIDRLPTPYREVLLLRDIEEFDTEHTAALLGISEPAVKTRLHRARQALRSLFENLFCQEQVLSD